MLSQIYIDEIVFSFFFCFSDCRYVGASEKVEGKHRREDDEEKNSFLKKILPLFHTISKKIG